MSGLLANPRVTKHIGDGLEFLKRSKGLADGKFDVVITDCSDPDGPAHPLFTPEYFALLREVLSPRGRVAIQAEAMWLELRDIGVLWDTMRTAFPVVEYAYTTIPSYPSGQIGFMLASNDPAAELDSPVREVHGTRYYNAKMHSAAFVLPEFCEVLMREGRDIRPSFGKGSLRDAMASDGEGTS